MSGGACDPDILVKDIQRPVDIAGYLEGSEAFDSNPFSAAEVSK